MHWTAGFRCCQILDATSPPPVMCIVMYCDPKGFRGIPASVAVLYLNCCAGHSVDRHPAPSGASPLVGVAGLPNPEVSVDGKRAHDVLAEVLRAQGIEIVCAGSATWTLFVAPQHAELARKLLAKAIAREHIQAKVWE
jgi:hypothetical protein